MLVFAHKCYSSCTFWSWRKTIDKIFSCDFFSLSSHVLNIVQSLKKNIDHITHLHAQNSNKRYSIYSSNPVECHHVVHAMIGIVHQEICKVVFKVIKFRLSLWMYATKCQCVTSNLWRNLFPMSILCIIINLTLPHAAFVRRGIYETVE